MRSTQFASPKGFWGAEKGSAVVAHVLVQALVLLVFLGLIQLSFALYLRNSLIDVAQSAARRAALVGGSESEGMARARELIKRQFGGAYSANIQISQSLSSSFESARPGSSFGSTDLPETDRLSGAVSELTQRNDPVGPGNLDRGLWKSVTVRIEAPLPLLGPIGPAGGIAVTATSVLPADEPR